MRRGLARSRGEARDLVLDGVVHIGEVLARKPSQPVDGATPLTVAAPGPRWVGRGAVKLLAALDTWGPDGLSARGRRCIDVGASTGGFTQVLLESGARHVVALDVGRDQLAAEIVADPRVLDLPGTTVRGLTPQDVGGPFDLLVTDLSFISLTLVAHELAGLLGPEGDLVALVKPQFEVGRERLGRGGLVTDPRARADALTQVVAAFRAEGLHVRGLATSPVTGSTGNVEYLLWARSDRSDTMTEDEVRAAVRAVGHDSTGGGR